MDSYGREFSSQLLKFVRVSIASIQSSKLKVLVKRICERESKPLW